MPATLPPPDALLEGNRQRVAQVGEPDGFDETGGNSAKPERHGRRPGLGLLS